MYYMGLSYVEGYNIPIWQRRWFLERIQKEIKKSNDANNGEGGASRGAQHNSPDVRAMMGRQRAMVPSKLRRFT
jgi:hypothetical protein